jgi:uncharacterized protein (TIGR03435 family)
MQRAFTSLILFACGAALGLAAGGPQFDVASVKPSGPMTAGTKMRVGSNGGPGTSDPGQVTYTNLTLRNLLATAYDVKVYQISGPSWLDTERYDIIAKMPPETNWEQFRMMLQNLLAERFKLTLHHETKDLPLYELVVAKNGTKLKPWVSDPNAPAPPEPGARFTPPAIGKDGSPIVPPGASIMSMLVTNGAQRMRMTSSKQSLPKLAEMLANQLGRPVVDKTGLTGEYDYTLEFSPEGLTRGMLGGLPPPPKSPEDSPVAGPAGDQDLPSLLAAVQEQLGLRLESKKGPMDLLVIDRADKTPTEN